jgi:hypothetical protein
MKHVRRRPKATKTKAQSQDKAVVQPPSGPIANLTGVSEAVEGLVHEMLDLVRHSSKKSTDSKESKKSDKGKMHVVIAPAAAALVDSDSDDEDDGDDHAFDHPSTYVHQPWIWIPKDTLGLSEALVMDLKKSGVEASSVGAVMDEKGVVTVSRNPPDEDWHGGQQE